MAYTDLTDFYRVVDTLLADHEERIRDDAIDAIAEYIVSGGAQTFTDAMTKLADRMRGEIEDENDRWVAQSRADEDEARAERREANRE